MKNKQGFTLVELSIVLLIIGLIIGGITAGSSLINQAGLRSVISEYNQYKTSVNTFKIQYNALPGDMNNATTFWYNATTCPGTAGTAGGCNGDGNGYILFNYSSTTNDESLRAWQHLSLSGIINGNYTGTHTVTNQNDPGVNVPQSKYSNAIWGFESSPTSLNSGALYGNAIFLGSFSSGGPGNGPSLAAIDAQTIDTKIDDGIPISGAVHAIYNDGPGNWGISWSPANICALSASNTYKITTTGKICLLEFMLGI
jgi:prepilin-type N-terminal cleavage/methylation domain-containing protein